MTSEVLLKNEFGHAELYQLGESLRGIKFYHDKCQGAVSLYGGQVLSWQPQKQQTIFWLSDDSQYSTSHAIRGGIPICWPWFGGEVKSAQGNIEKANNHGFARQSQWHLDDIEVNESEVIIVLSLSGKHYSAHWPAAFKLTQTLVFSEQFRQTLTMTNLSEHTVEYTAALHSYFCVSNPEQVIIQGLDSFAYDDKLSGGKKQVSTLENCLGPVDRIYYNGDSKTIIDNGWQRAITVTSDNCQQWVLWNPGQTVTTMPDMHAKSEQEFVCLEAANTHWQAIASQASVSLSQQIVVDNF